MLCQILSNLHLLFASPPHGTQMGPRGVPFFTFHALSTNHKAGTPELFEASGRQPFLLNSDPLSEESDKLRSISPSACYVSLDASARYMFAPLLTMVE